MKKIVLGLALATTMAGCSTAPEKTGSIATQNQTSYIVSPVVGNNGGKTYFLTKNDDKWTASKVGSLSEDNVEAVAVDVLSKEITLRAQVSSDDTTRRNDQWVCGRGLTGQSRKKNGYTVCTSSLMQAASHAASAFTNILFSPLVVLTGTAMVTVAVDQVEVLEIAKSSGLIQMAEQDNLNRLAAIEKNTQNAIAARQKIEQERLALDQQAEQGDANTKYQRGLAYLGSYSWNADAENWFKKSAAAGSADAYFKLGLFQRDHYTNQSEAETLWSKAAHGENVDAKNILNDLASERHRAAQAAKEDAARVAQEQKQLAAFRKSLADGEETNCGPVIETKAKTVKISFALANYGNEHWIRRDEIYPAGYGCRFVNGQYQSPR